MMTTAKRVSDDVVQLPRIDGWLMSGFGQVFLPRFLRKHFHNVAVDRRTLSTPPEVGSAVVVYANHASWWDPMVAMFLRSRLLPRHRLYAPIDSTALERYQIFKRMGFYGIALNTQHGAAEFLRRSLRIVQSPTASLWLTPEGKFTDVRNLAQPLMPGLAHLAATIERTAGPGPQGSRNVWFLPAAIEYSFWEERLPECLCRLGTPIHIHWATRTLDKQAWDRRLSEALRQTQAELAEACIARDVSQFEVMLSGHTGSWGPYDIGRRLVAKLSRQSLTLEHSDKFSAPPSK